MRKRAMVFRTGWAPVNTVIEACEPTRTPSSVAFLGVEIHQDRESLSLTEPVLVVLDGRVAGPGLRRVDPDAEYPVPRTVPSEHPTGKYVEQDLDPVAGSLTCPEVVLGEVGLHPQIVDGDEGHQRLVRHWR